MVNKFPFLRLIWFPLVIYLPNLFILLFGRKVFGFDAYLQLPWLDTPMHFLGGVSIAYSLAVALEFAEDRHWLRVWSPWVVIALISIGTVFAAVAWEGEEFLSDHLLGTRQQISNTDTMKDLFNGLVGGLVGALIFPKKRKESK